MNLGGPAVNDILLGDWVHDAACAGKPQRWWFPTEQQIRQRSHEDPYLLARMTCVRCPVIADCLRHVLTSPEPLGMWAALTPEERRALARQREQVAA